MPSRSENPYVGPVAFEEKDRLYFFGRDEESRQLTSLVVAHRVVLFYAESGAGKTSLLQAKVIPELRERKRLAPLAGRVGGALPPEVDPARAGNIFVFNLLLNLGGEAARPGALTGLSLTEGLRSYLEPAAAGERARAYLLVLDQFEEIFTQPAPATERAEFFRQLQECLATYNQLSLLLSMREDFIALLDFHAAQMPDRLRTRFRMERLSTAAALQAIRDPAARAGCPFDTGVAEILVGSLSGAAPELAAASGATAGGSANSPGQASDFVEPVHLQMVCWRLWNSLPEDKSSIQKEDVQAFADVDRALMDFYEDALRKVFKATTVGQRRLRAWFDQKLITPGHTRGLVLMGETETEGLPNAAVKILDKAYIIRPMPRGKDRWYELTHDRMVEPILEANRAWRDGHQARTLPSVAPQASPLGKAPVANPFVGPRSFQASEALPGRASEVSALLDLLITERVVLFYSPPGAGKTSLIRAGLVPALAAENFRVLGPIDVRADVADEAPGAGEAAPRNPYVLSALASLEAGLPAAEQALPAYLATLDVVSYLDRHPAPESTDGDVLIFDQFEQILAPGPADQAARADFFRQLGHALENPRRRALFAMREEFIAGLDPYLDDIPGNLTARYRLDLLSAQTAVEIVQKGARAGGKVFSEAAAQALIDRLRAMRIQRSDGTFEETLGPTVEPLHLQLVCRRLWDNLAPGAVEIQLADLENLGDVDQVLRAYYTDRVREIAAQTGVSERSIRRWIEEELIGPSGYRAPVLLEREQTRGMDNRVLRELIDSYLVRAERRRGGTFLTLASDRWLDPVRADNVAWLEANLNALQRQAALWHGQNQPAGLLLRGEGLAQAEAWAAGHAGELEQNERDFLEESRKASAAIERERRQNRRIRLLAMVSTALSVLALLALALALLQRNQTLAAWSAQAAASTAAVEQQMVARTAEADAQVRAVVAQQAAVAADAQRVVAQRAEATAVQAAGTADAARLQLQNVLATKEAGLAASLSPATTAPSRTPTRASTLRPGGSVTPPGASATPVPDHTGTVEAQQTSDARQMVLAQLNDVRTTQTALAQAIARQATPTPPALGSPRGRIVYAVHYGVGVNNLFSIGPDGSGLKQLTIDGGREPSFSPANGGLLVFSKNTKVGDVLRVWLHAMPASGGPSWPIDDGAWDDWESAISPDGLTVAFTSSRLNRDWEIYVMPYGDPSRAQALTNDPNVRSSVPAWSPDGKRIAFVRDSANQQPEIWVMNADGTGATALTNNNAFDGYPVWSPDGSRIAFSTDRDGNLDIFVMDANGDNPRNVTKSREDENFPAWSPDGAWLAFARYVGNTDIFIMPVQGGQATNLTKSTPDDSAPVWLP